MPARLRLDRDARTGYQTLVQDVVCIRSNAGLRALLAGVSRSGGALLRELGGAAGVHQTSQVAVA